MNQMDDMRLVGFGTWLLLLAAVWSLTALGCRILAIQPEPSDEPDADTKLPYAALVDRRFVLGCLGLATLAVGILPSLSPAYWPMWIVYGSLTLVLVACDARTTWLPLPMTRICQLAMLLALLATVGWTRVAPNAADRVAGQILVGAVGGALAAAGLFWLIWRFIGQLGFGDVRLAVSTGAVSGALGFDCWLSALFFGTLAAAIWGVVTTLRRRRRPSALGKAFPYGPGLWSGPYLAVLLAAL